METKSIFDATVFPYGCQAHILNLIARDLLADKGRAATSGQVLAVLTIIFVFSKGDTKIANKIP